MGTWILIVALLYKHPAPAPSSAAAVQVEFATAEACNEAMAKVKAEWGSSPGVAVLAVCVSSGFKK